MNAIIHATSNQENHNLRSIRFSNSTTQIKSSKEKQRAIEIESIYKRAKGLDTDASLTEEILSEVKKYGLNWNMKTNGLIETHNNQPTEIHSKSHSFNQTVDKAISTAGKPPLPPPMVPDIPPEWRVTKITKQCIVDVDSE
jgi:hypothetical protein